MELAELLGLIQFEVQKSYDFAADLARQELSSTSSVLQMAMERVEIDLPVLLSEKKRRFNRSDAEMQPLPSFAKRYVMPFVPGKLSVTGKANVPKGELEGDVVDVELIGPQENEDDSLKAERIARLKITLKPVMK
jgi:hypothetical protein